MSGSFAGLFTCTIFCNCFFSPNASLLTLWLSNLGSYISALIIICLQNMQFPQPERISIFLSSRNCYLFIWNDSIKNFLLFVLKTHTHLYQPYLSYVKVHISRLAAHLKYWISFKVHTNAECVVKGLQMFKPAKFCSFYCSNFGMLQGKSAFHWAWLHFSTKLFPYRCVTRVWCVTRVTVITFLDSVVKGTKKTRKGLIVNFLLSSTNKFIYLCHGNSYQSTTSTSAKFSAVFNKLILLFGLRKFANFQSDRSQWWFHAQKYRTTTI